tara:strand:+ start:111 stop:251 length:141 start_codon:yes stop_codon:yes gene_type:complete
MGRERKCLNLANRLRKLKLLALQMLEMSNSLMLMQNHVIAAARDGH